MDICLLGATKRLINSAAIKTEDLQFITSSALLHFSLFAFIPVIARNQISINCQILRELGWVFSKWCQGCGNHFVAAGAVSEASLRCNSHANAGAGVWRALGGLRSEVLSLGSSHLSSLHNEFFAHIIYLWISPFYSRTDLKLVSGSRKELCQGEKFLLISEEVLWRERSQIFSHFPFLEMLVIVSCPITLPGWPTVSYPPSSAEFSSYETLPPPREGL